MNRCKLCQEKIEKPQRKSYCQTCADTTKYCTPEAEFHTRKESGEFMVPEDYERLRAKIMSEI